MATAQTTTNYGLPIFAGSDKGNWFDFNNGFQSIDAAIKAAADAASAAQVAAQAANTAAQAAQSVATTTNTALTKLSNNIQNWIGFTPTNALTNIVNEVTNRWGGWCKELNLLHIRATCQGVSGQKWAANDKFLNLAIPEGKIDPITSAKAINVCAFLTYGKSDNTRATMVLSGQINTDWTLQINSAPPTDMDNTKSWGVNFNLMLSTNLWWG